MEFVVHKFGGSGLSDADKIRNISCLIKGSNESVVVSAIGKTTHHLQQAISMAKSRKDFNIHLDKISLNHFDILDKLLAGVKSLKKVIEKDIANIRHMLESIALSQICSDSQAHYILGYGELWSAQILTKYLLKKKVRACFLDASDILVIDESVKPSMLNWSKSERNLKTLIKGQAQASKAKVYVITGFVAQNHDAQRTILGLNCSDYSAAIFAKLQKATKLIIWTDVAGIYSANPQIVKGAKPLKFLSYKEALEMAYFGASVIHPLTIAPMMQKKIPIYIKSSFDPDIQGTLVSDKDSNILESSQLIKGLITVDNVAIVRLQGAGIIGVSGACARVFSVLESADISVMMISQSSSEYSICFAILQSQTKKTVRALEKHFCIEIQRGDIENIHCDSDYVLLTGVGDAMRNKPGALATLINPLVMAKINIHAVAQGSSERSITLAIKKEDEEKALNIIHNKVVEQQKKRIAIVLMGFGNIAKSLLLLLNKQRQTLIDQGVFIDLVAVCNSKKMILKDNLLGVNISSFLDKASKSTNINIDNLTSHLLNANAQIKVVIDATSSLSLAERYIEILSKGIHIVTPNKKANTLSMDYYRCMRDAAAKNNTQFKYETNVLAGLPIIYTLDNLQASGDKIIKLQGVFSGTLAFIFSQINSGKSFVESMMLAYEKGFTEPDPREDLSGMDVARKTLCLAREIGIELELDKIKVKGLLPEHLYKGSCENFLKKVKGFDQEITDNLLKNKKNSQALQFISEINCDSSIKGSIKVGAIACDKDSHFGRLSGNDNILLIYSNYYKSQPLVIQGAGAGVEVTAAGVFSDLLDVIKKNH